MTVGLLFGGFWLGLGVLMWWWPAAIFVAFSSGDVTPGARGFAIVSIAIGLGFLSLEFPALSLGTALPLTVLLVGALQLLRPVTVFSVDEEGLVTQRHLGVATLVAGVAWTALSIV